MLLFFQVFFIILAAILATAVFFVGVWFDWTWAIICAIFAAICYFASMSCKNAIAKRNPQQMDEKTTENDE